MGNLRLAQFTFLLLVLLIGCPRGRESADIVYAGWNDLFMIGMPAGKIIKRVAVEAQINDLQPAEDGRLFLATTRGLLVVNTSSMEVQRNVPLGILDSVEYDKNRNVVYALLHPGNNPNESNGPHRLLKLSGDDYRELGNFSLEPWTYDIFLDPSGDYIYVTHMAGRTVLRIATENFTESEKLWFGEGGTWEGRMILLRHLAFSRDGSLIYLLEQGESNPTCVWVYSPETGEKKKRCLDEEAMIQGMVTSPDGSRLFANGLTELIIMDSNGKEISRTKLNAKHRWIALSRDANMIYLTADTGEEEGQITCVDTRGNLVREVKLPTPLNVIAVK